MIYIMFYFFYKKRKSALKWKDEKKDIWQGPKILLNLSFLSLEYFWRFLDSQIQKFNGFEILVKFNFFITHVFTVVWTDSKCWGVRLSECRSDNSLLYSRMNSLKEDSTFCLDGGGVMKSYSQDGEKSFSRLRRKYRR